MPVAKFNRRFIYVRTYCLVALDSSKTIRNCVRTSYADKAKLRNVQYVPTPQYLLHMFIIEISTNMDSSAQYPRGKFLDRH